MRVVVGVGSNLGDRLATLREARRRISAFAEVRAVSRVYETAPIGPAQPSFLNAAMYVECMQLPLVFLRELRRVETELGRRREVEQRWGPRTLDLDVLWIEGEFVDEPELIVPHPRLHERAFAVAPLLEVAPHAVDPRTSERYVVPADQDVRVTDFTW